MLRLEDESTQSSEVKCESTTEAVIAGGVSTLEAMQESVRKAGVWLHKDQDFSGTPENHDLPPLLLLPAPTPVQLQITEMHQAELDRIDALLHTRVLPDISVIKPGTAEDEVANDGQLRQYLQERRPKGEGTTLANIALLPTKDNVGEWRIFLPLHKQF